MQKIWEEIGKQAFESTEKVIPFTSIQAWGGIGKIVASALKGIFSLQSEQLNPIDYIDLDQTETQRMPENILALPLRKEFCLLSKEGLQNKRLKEAGLNEGIIELLENVPPALRQPLGAGVRLIGWAVGKVELDKVANKIQKRAISIKRNLVDLQRTGKRVPRYIPTFTIGSLLGGTGSSNIVRSSYLTQYYFERQNIPNFHILIAVLPSVLELEPNVDQRRIRASAYRSLRELKECIKPSYTFSEKLDSKDLHLQVAPASMVLFVGGGKPMKAWNKNEAAWSIARFINFLIRPEGTEFIRRIIDDFKLTQKNFLHVATFGEQQILFSPQLLIYLNALDTAFSLAEEYTANYEGKGASLIESFSIQEENRKIGRLEDEFETKITLWEGNFSQLSLRERRDALSSYLKLGMENILEDMEEEYNKDKDAKLQGIQEKFLDELHSILQTKKAGVAIAKAWLEEEKKLINEKKIAPLAEQFEKIEKIYEQKSEFRKEFTAKFMKSSKSFLKRFFLFFYLRRLSQRCLEALFEEKRTFIKVTRLRKRLELFEQIRRWIEVKIRDLEEFEGKFVRVKKWLENERISFRENELKQFETAAGHILIIPSVLSRIKQEIREEDLDNCFKKLFQRESIELLLQISSKELGERLVDCTKDLFEFLKDLSLEAFLDRYLSDEEFKEITDWLLNESDYLVPITGRIKRSYKLVFLNGGENSKLKNRLCEMNPEFNEEFQFFNSRNRNRLQIINVAIGVSLDDLLKEYEDDYLSLDSQERIFFHTGILDEGETK